MLRQWLGLNASALLILFVPIVRGPQLCLCLCGYHEGRESWLLHIIFNNNLTCILETP